MGGQAAGWGGAVRPALGRGGCAPCGVVGAGEGGGGAGGSRAQVGDGWSPLVRLRYCAQRPGGYLTLVIAIQSRLLGIDCSIPFSLDMPT
ncbi:hypothetical protein HOK021_12420 [Streptomyces hygroscopicus]|nr:hypothetical protein HOK021_12420 [Streptomyces hygroscopicus]